MTMVKITSEQSCTIKSNNPLFKYKFEAGKEVEVKEEHAEKILKNSNFSTKAKKEKSKKE